MPEAGHQREHVLPMAYRRRASASPTDTTTSQPTINNPKLTATPPFMAAVTVARGLLQFGNSPLGNKLTRRHGCRAISADSTLRALASDSSCPASVRRATSTRADFDTRPRRSPASELTPPPPSRGGAGRPGTRCRDDIRPPGITIEKTTWSWPAYFLPSCRLSNDAGPEVGQTSRSNDARGGGRGDAVGTATLVAAAPGRAVPNPLRRRANASGFRTS